MPYSAAGPVMSYMPTPICIMVSLALKPSSRSFAHFRRLISSNVQIYNYLTLNHSWDLPNKLMPIYPRAVNTSSLTHILHLYISPSSGSRIVPPAYSRPNSLSTFPVFFMSFKMIMPMSGLFFKSPVHLLQTLSGGSIKSLVILPKYTPFFSNISI